MPYQPILEDPDQITSLAGQRFVVLRAPLEVASPWGALQRGLREQLAGTPVFYPAVAHLTLCGFAAGTSIDTLRSVMTSWAANVPALRLEADRMSVFPPPAQVASVDIRKTPELVSTLTSLRALAEQQHMTMSTTTPLDQWVPRMSLVYGGRLDGPAWQALRALTESLQWAPAGGFVRRAEILAFDEGREHSGGEFALATLGETSDRRSPS